MGTVVAPSSKGFIQMGKRDFHPLSANFLFSKWLPSHWANYCERKREGGQVADPADWRIARTIFVADDEATAKRYGRDDPRSPYRYYWKQLTYKMMRVRRHVIFKFDQPEPDSAFTEDLVLDNLVIHGTVNSVVDQILKLREQVGYFGELVYAGMDWVDPKLTKHPMDLMAMEVMRRVNAAISNSAREGKAAKVA